MYGDSTGVRGGSEHGSPNFSSLVQPTVCTKDEKFSRESI